MMMGMTMVVVAIMVVRMRMVAEEFCRYKGQSAEL